MKRILKKNTEISYSDAQESDVEILLEFQIRDFLRFFIKTFVVIAKNYYFCE